MRLNPEVDVKNVITQKEQNKRLSGIKGKVEFIPLAKAIGTEWEESIKELAIKDVFAKRASRAKFLRKNALVVTVDGQFAAFSIFESDSKAQQFYQWQIGIDAPYKGKGLAKVIVNETLSRNVNNYPAVVSVFNKNEISLGLFQSCGFEVYRKTGGLYRLTRGGIVDGKEVTASSVGRVKALIGINPTNLWNSAKGDWRQAKAAWNELIETAGTMADVDNPTYASREGCWQKDGGLAAFATGKALNDGASVLDPFVCELLCKLFMPKNGNRIYNPFGGGVQMGFIAGTLQHDYVGSEIRQNQCDANNAICQAMDLPAKWIKSDSSTYEPEGMFDMIFSCPPYYKVEKYIDYEGVIPEGELNDLDTYEEFRDMLFQGYKKAIAVLNDNRFFCVMVGDSRDSKGAYYCCEAETILFLREQGLHVYNKIVYMETQFTRAMQVPKTIRTRKLPKTEQKIIIAYKGNLKNIKAEFEDFGRI